MTLSPVTHPIRLTLTLTLGLLLAQHHAAAMKCPLGTRTTKSGLCEKCPAGTFGQIPAGPSCNNCPAGTFNRFKGVVSIQLCRPCPKHKTSSAGSPTCTVCPVGRIGACGSCITCPRGTYFNSLACTCFDCSHGGVTTTTNRDSCTNCLQGTVTNALHSKCIPAVCSDGFFHDGYECMPCDYNTFRVGANMSACAECPFGSITDNFNGPNSRCIRCRSGTYVTDLLPQTFTYEQVSLCMPCPDGTLTRGLHKPLCRAPQAKCPPNSFLDFEGDCQICDHNHRVDLVSKRCVACPYGSASVRGTPSECVTCPEGASGDHSGKCRCPPGQGVFQGKCKICPAGSFSDIESNECQPCGRDAVSERGATRCTECEDVVGGGSRTVGEDGTKCVSEADTCPWGYFYGMPYYASFGDLECVSLQTGCPRGSRAVHGSGDDKVVCKKVGTDDVVCPPRSRFDGVECMGCVDGFYLSATGRSSGRVLKCKKCPKGSVSTGGDITGCVTCNEGFAVWDRFHPSRCVCERGRFIDASEGGVCKKCGKGSTTTEIDQTECVACGKGFEKGRWDWEGCVCRLPNVVNSEGECVNDDSGAPEYPR